MKENTRFLNELTPEELTELYKNNEFLQNQAQEEAAENVYFWLDDILRNFRGQRQIDYNIGYPGNYFTFKTTYASYENYKDFFETVETLKENYCLFTEETAGKIKRATAKIYFYLDCIFGYEDISESNQEKIENWLDEIIKTASDEILDFCVKEYESQFDDELIENEFLTLFIENCGDQYTTDGKTIFETEYRQYN